MLGAAQQINDAGKADRMIPPLFLLLVHIDDDMERKTSVFWRAIEKYICLGGESFMSIAYSAANC